MSTLLCSEDLQTFAQAFYFSVSSSLQNEDKDRTIRHLQRQMELIPSPVRSPDLPPVAETANAATQTDRVSS